MITCPNCKTQLEDGTKFCMLCGAPVGQQGTPVAQPEPQPEPPVEEAYETAPLVEEVYETVPSMEYVYEDAPIAEPEKKRKKIPVKFIVIGLAVIAVIVAVIVALFMFFGSNAKEKSAVYLKDGKLYLSLLDGKEPIKITSKFVDNEDDAFLTYYAGWFVSISEDGKNIFYPENTTMSDDNFKFDLCYRSTTDPDAKGEEIESDVSSYTVSKDSKFVVYQTVDGDFYVYDIKKQESDRIDKKVSDWYSSEDLKTIVYMTEDGDLHLWKYGKDSEKLESNVDWVTHVTKDASKVFYRKDDNLYVKEGTKDEEKIASNVSDVIQAYDNGGVYYTKSETTTTTLADYIIDDYADSDAAMVRPEWPSYYDYQWPEAPDYVYYWDYDTEEAYQQALAEYDLAYAAYEAEYARVNAQYEADQENYYVLDEAWDAKLDRDYYRESAKSYEFSNTKITLYYYDGKDSVVVTSLVDEELYSWGEYSYSQSDETPVMLIHTSERAKVGMVRIEEINSMYDTYEKVQQALTPQVAFAVVREDECSVLASEEMESYGILDGAKEIYYLKNLDIETYEGDLYVASVEKEIGDADKYASDVFGVSCLASGEIIYYKDVERDEETYSYIGTLFIGDEKIEKDVAVGSLRETEDGKMYYFFNDIEGSEGTLCYYKNGKVEEIADDVYQNIVLTPEGGVLYLVDYDEEDREGTLYYSVNGKEGEEIDDDVAAIVTRSAY